MAIMRRSLMTSVALAAVPGLLRAQGGGASAPPGGSQATNAVPWPTRPMRLLLGFAPGGVADIVARLVAPRLGEVLGQTVVVDNRPGAGGIVATEAAVRSPPNGETLLWTTSSTATGVALYRRLPYDAAADLAFVSTVSYFDHVLAVPPDFPPRTMTELRDYARANPGKLNIGSISVGNAQHLGAELLRSMLGVEATVITYRSTPELLNATATGDIQVASEILPPVLPQLQAGRLRALAIAAPRRFPGLPDVPTAEEAGLPGYVVRSWNGITLPIQTPRVVVDRLTAAIGQVMAAPDLQVRLRELGASPEASTAEAFQAFFTSEVMRWHGVIDGARIERL